MIFKTIRSLRRLSADLFVSLRRNGLSGTCQIIWSTFVDIGFDFKRMTVTRGDFLIEDIPEYESRNPVYYAPTRALPFFALMNKLQIQKDCTFVDFGAGKGRVLMMASDLGFQKVRGIEISPYLASKALKNANRNVKSEQKAEVICGDMMKYQPCEGDSVFYFYDPADFSVVCHCIQNIALFAKKSSNELWVIFHHNLIDPSVVQASDFHPLNYQGPVMLQGNRFFIWRRAPI